MAKLMAVFGVLGMGEEDEVVSKKVQIEIDPGDLYEASEKTIRNAEKKALGGWDVVLASYYEGTVEVEA